MSSSILSAETFSAARAQGISELENFDVDQLQAILLDLDRPERSSGRGGKAKLPPIAFSNEEERKKLEENLTKAKRALIDVKRVEATKHLVHGNFEQSVVEATHALKLCMDVHGSGKVELVPCYLLLAEANLGLGRQKHSAEYLARANWCILKNPDCSNRLKSQLYRNFGKLYASQGKHDEALRQLANDVYFSSLQVGPEHVDTAGGFYYMATVFYLQQRIECALAMCDKVIEIWMKRAKALPSGESQAAGKGEVNEQNKLSEAQVMEGLQIVSKIVVLREEALGPEHVSTGEACYALGLLYQYTKEDPKARGLLKKAYTIYGQELGGDNPSTQEVRSSLIALGVSADSLEEFAAADVPVTGAMNQPPPAVLEEEEVQGDDAQADASPEGASVAEGEAGAAPEEATAAEAVEETAADEGAAGEAGASEEGGGAEEASEAAPAAEGGEGEAEAAPEAEAEAAPAAEGGEGEAEAAPEAEAEAAPAAEGEDGEAGAE